MPKEKDYTPSELCDIYHKDPYYLERRCGKWYVRKKEVKDIKRWLATDGRKFPNARTITEFIDMFNVKYHDPEADWYPLPIIEEARKQIKEVGLLPLAFPLNEKQLIIINALLHHDSERAFILTGVGGSGKSTYANIICQIFDNDRSSCSLSDLSNRFKLETAMQHRLIYSDELNSEDLNNGIIKMLISNQMVTVEQKNQVPYDTRCQSSFIWSCNNRPRIDLSDTGMLRRFVYYPMNKKISNPNPLFKSKKYTHEDLVNIVAHSLCVDMTDWFSKFEFETHYYLLRDNPVFMFRKLTTGEKSTYCQYAEKCRDSGYKPVAMMKWQSIMDLIAEWDLYDIKEKEVEECLKK